MTTVIVMKHEKCISDRGIYKSPVGPCMRQARLDLFLMIVMKPVATY